MASAEDLGRKLVREIEVVGLDEIFHALRLQNGSSNTRYFGFQPLDQLLQVVTDARTQSSNARIAPPIIELMSLAPGGGKTHLLYYLCALAVLPTEISGAQACVIIVDTDSNFSIPRLAAQLELLVHQRSSEAYAEDDKHAGEMVLLSLKHVHIFRPQTPASTIATIDSLPAYLFNNDRHFSFDRPVGFLALDSASTFYWQDRAETEDAAFLATTAEAGDRKLPAPQSGFASLAASLKATCRTFCCPAVITTWYLGSTPVQQQQSSYLRSFRSSFPTPFASLPSLRLVIQRVPVRKFPPGISVSDALREADDRRKAVEEGKFECFVNEWGVDERMLSKLRGSFGGGGFRFRILHEGMVMQEPHLAEK